MCCRSALGLSLAVSACFVLAAPLPPAKGLSAEWSTEMSGTSGVKTRWTADGVFVKFPRAEHASTRSLTFTRACSGDFAISARMLVPKNQDLGKFGFIVSSGQFACTIIPEFHWVKGRPAAPEVARLHISLEKEKKFNCGERIKTVIEGCQHVKLVRVDGDYWLEISTDGNDWHDLLKCQDILFNFNRKGRFPLHCIAGESGEVRVGVFVETESTEEAELHLGRWTVQTTNGR